MAATSVNDNIYRRREENSAAVAATVLLVCGKNCRNVNRLISKATAMLDSLKLDGSNCLASSATHQLDVSSGAHRIRHRG
jgi:hypothetical protein